MALTKISRSLLDTGISDSSDATAITIDSSENITVVGSLTIDTGTNGVGDLYFLNDSANDGGNATVADNTAMIIKSDGTIEHIGTSIQRLYTKYMHSDGSTLSGWIGAGSALGAYGNTDLLFRANNSLYFTVNNSGTVANTRMVIDDNSRISLSNNDSGTSNTIFGKNTANSLDAGSNYNTFIGENVADATLNDATYNVGIGYNALTDLTSADSNVAVGALCAENITTGAENTAVGTGAMRNSLLAGNCVFVGREAGGNGVITADANGSVGVGMQSLYALTSGGKNVAVGYIAGSSITTGDSNVAIGHNAMDELVDGDRNIAIGHNAMGNVVGGTTSDGSSDNIFIGFQSGGGAWTDSVCSQNIGIGSYSLDGALDSADFNTTVGAYGLSNVSSGSNNTSLGRESGTVITTGSNNTCIGYDSEPSANSASNQTVIGASAVGQADNSVTLGNASVTAVYMAQDSGAVVYASGVNFPDSHSASGDANTLDDYQEGTWTPVLAVDSTDLSNQDGATVATYTKIGRMVWFELSYKFDGGETIPSGIHLTLRGLPETPSISNQHNVGIGQVLDHNTARYPIVGYWITDRVYLHRSDTGASLDESSPMNWANEDYLTFRGFYKV